MNRALATFAFAFASTAGTAAAVADGAPVRADACRPTVVLDGDAQLVATLGAELAGRGIAVEGDCPARRARIERRGQGFVISIADASHTPVERSVRDLHTAASVVESFVRDDVAMPLLATPPPEPAPALHTKAEVVSAAAPRGLPTGVHLFFGLEASRANDGTSWKGAHLGACVMAGPLCLAVRLRGGAVSTHTNFWDVGQRNSFEALAGIDVPFSIGRFLVTPGFAGGVGAVSTRDQPDQPSVSNTLRAQVHASVSIPLTRSLAIDLFLVGALAQLATKDPGYMSSFPEEPFGFIRYGVAMRYGRR